VDPCVFCEIAKKRMEAEIVFEDNYVMAFLDSDPINEGHILLMPKDHFLDVDVMPEYMLHHLMDISQQMVAAIKKTYRPDGYSMMQNGGMFNDIGHYHLHIFPRYKGDGFGWMMGSGRPTADNKIAQKIISNIKRA